MPKLIAVIDDDPTFLALMRELLQVEEGYAVLLLHDESMAYERVREAQPDAIMVDIRLEHVDGGWLVLRAIRSDPALARTPVIVCSGDLHAIQGHAADLRRLHCVAIPKPFDLDDLLCTVARLI